MRKLTTIALVTPAAVCGPFAAGAVASPGDDVRDLSCQVQEKLGIANVQQCDF